MFTIIYFITVNDSYYDSPCILWTATVISSPNTGSTIIVIQLSAHCKQKNNLGHLKIHFYFTLITIL
jgi:hypothetical protein